ncbi:MULTISPECIES: SDR family oxidoreductase [Mesorhizobium]|uniref:SDR family oxidoreductase n=1 Tax=Mesorhizobium denitrificans TaxID=2294114 RepID=A0A371X988_9HYPH|nr:MULTISPECIES: SDR family oxidoreductase [Mesorhizobium]RFC65772.1 SDR family oxidoreductase [Mesorhizobium denitrificans]
MKLDLTGKRAVVTAGGSGIGLAIAKAFAAAGAKVAICDVDADAVDNSSFFSRICDVSDEVQVATFFEAVKGEFGGIDILVNNAGIAGPTKVVENISLAEWERTLAVNVTGQFLCARAVIPDMKKQRSGVILNLSSTAGRMGMPLRGPYSASKYAVRGLTDVLAIELGEFGIRVNALLPGMVAGPRLDKVVAEQAAAKNIPPDTYLQLMLHNVSLHTTVTPEDVAATAVFLASDAASRISGQSVGVCANFESYRSPLFEVVPDV